MNNNTEHNELQTSERKVFLNTLLYFQDNKKSFDGRAPTEQRDSRDTGLGKMAGRSNIR